MRMRMQKGTDIDSFLKTANSLYEQYAIQFTVSRI